MDWPLILQRNRERLLAVLAPLFAVLGFDHRRRGEMPRHFYRSWLILLRPAESAVRRLIVIAARGIVVKLSAARALRRAVTGTSPARSTSFLTTAIILRVRLGRGRTRLEVSSFGSNLEARRQRRARFGAAVRWSASPSAPFSAPLPPHPALSPRGEGKPAALPCWPISKAKPAGLPLSPWGEGRVR
jgi:hypothetical protein